MSGHPRGIQQPLVCGTGVATQTRRANTCGRTNLKGHLPVGSVSKRPDTFGVGSLSTSMTTNLYTRTALALLAVGAAFLLLGCEEQVPSPQTGKISITSTPSGARIFLDGSDTGRVTPYMTPGVSAGSHSIRLTLAGHADWEQRDVPVSAGQITTVHALLQRTNQPPEPEPEPPSERGLGLNPMDVQAYQSAHVIRADPVSLPSSVDLSVDAPVPGDQGLQGSCVGWAVAYVVKTYQERIERGWPLTDNRHVMSPAYVYNQIKVPGGGAYFVDAFVLLIDQGVSSWAQMPYDPLDDRTQPSNRARTEAANYKIADWGTVQRTTHAVFVREIKRHLVAGDPVVIGIPTYPDFEYLSESNPVYDDDAGASRGYHAVVIVGYDDRRSAFRVANSWGTEWGIGGYGWIDYDASESLIRSAYVTKDVVASPTNERPEAASDPSPGAAATAVAVNTVLRWTRNARTTSFDVYLGTDANLGANDFQGSVAQARFAPHLAPGSRYYWRVDARGAGGITQGPVWTFTTAGTLEKPGKAVNPNPADGATGVAQNTELSWDSGGRTTSYDVYLGTAPVLDASELQQTQATRTYSPRGLQAGTRYYWRVDAKNGQGTTTGDVWAFTTAVQLGPRRVTGPQPEDGATNVGILNDLSWSTVPGATSYIVYFGTAPSPGSNERQAEQAGTTFDMSLLQYDTTYYWRIDARNGQGITTGDVWSFTTVQAREPDTSPVLPPIGGKTYPVGDYMSERLPAATGGNGRLVYSLTPSIPGLTFDAGTRTLYGTPRQAGTYHMRYRATDEDGDTHSQLFTVTIEPEGRMPPIYVGSLPASVALMPGEQWVIPGSDIAAAFEEDEGERLTFEASGSDSTIVHVTQADDNTVTITALAMTGDATVTITATDEDGLTAEHVIAITVKAREPDTSPVLPPIDDKTYTVGIPISPWYLPGATGGNDPLIFDPGQGWPPGITVDFALVSGTPTQQGTYDVLYTVTDRDGDTDSQSFTITVIAQEPDTSPLLPSIGDKTYPLGEYVSERLSAATGGNGILAYSLTPSIPGMTFDAGTRTLYGTPRQAGTYHVRYRATDEDGDTDSRSFTVTVADTSLSLPSIGGRTYTQGTLISPWTLPAATGGTGVLTYHLYDIPPGLSIGSSQVQSQWRIPGDSADSFLMSGTPNQAGTYNLYYEVRDSNGDTDSVRFTITVTVHCNVSPSPRGKIYWTSPEAGKILRANLNGTGVETIYYRSPVQAGDGPGRYRNTPVGIAISGDKIYWVDESSVGVRRANLDGTCVERLVSGGNSPRAITVAGGKMYWTDYNDENRIKRANLDGTRIENLYSGRELPAEITVSGNRMYWTTMTRTGTFRTTGIGIRRANLDGTGVELLVTDTLEPYGIAVTSGKIYWTSSSGGRIQRSNLDGSSVETVITNLRRPLSIVIHSDKVYWIGALGEIRGANLDGTNVEVLVSPDGIGAAGRGLAIR